MSKDKPIIWETKTVKVTDLQPNVENPRQISEGDYQKFKQHILENDFTGGLKADTDLTVVSGNQRIRVLKDFGIEEITVTVPPKKLSREQFIKQTIAENLHFGSWLDDLRDSQLEEIGSSIEELSGGVEEITEEDEVEEDEFVEEEGMEVNVKEGDIYKLGNHRLMCGDSTDAGTVALLMNGEKADMVFTDPPYGINLDGDNSNRGSKTSLMDGGLKLKSFKDDSIDYAVMAFNIVQELNVKKQVWFGANYYCHNLPQTNNWLIWDKRVEDKMKNTNSDCELAWVLDGHSSCRIFRHLWNGLVKASEHGQKRVHPTQKPLELIKWSIGQYAPEAKSLLDLFGGSGSTLMACEQLDRKCYMMELDPHYCQVIINRWEELTGETAELLTKEGEKDDE